MCLTSIPCRTDSVHARTPGQPSTSTRQFGHWPAQQSSPRGRWYLKLREIVRRPEAWSAEPIVSPSYAFDALAVELEGDRPAAVDSLVGAGSQPVAHSGSPTQLTSLVVVSRSARNHARQPDR